jgi:endogenous inhibitor of DNA gyrase (YacG/DUF329 family)
MNSEPSSPRARLDTKKNRVLMLVSLAMAAGGLTLIVLGLQRDWGFLAVFWSGVLALLGGGWVVGLLAGGGVASVGCPHCGAAIEFTNIESARTEQCKRCGQWSAGTKTMRPLEPDHVANMAVFSVPLPKHEPRWPTHATGVPRCPVCAEASTRSVTLEASSALGNAFAALSPISIQRVHALRVPACSRHDDGIALDLLAMDGGEGLVLHFRSWAYFHDFVALNPLVRTLAEFLEHNERPLEVRAPLTCPVHEIPVLTAMGWVSTMDLLPSHQWMDDAAQNPVCLSLGTCLEQPSKGRHERERVAWCPECERGMAELARKR